MAWSQFVNKSSQQHKSDHDQEQERVTLKKTRRALRDILHRIDAVRF